MWVEANALGSFGTDTLIIGGESAGGNLCAATLLRRRDAFAANKLPLKIPFPWKLANLVYGGAGATPPLIPDP